MGTMEQHLGKPMATTLLHEPRDLWKSPRGTVIRIEAFTLVAIALSFFLATFGSSRRWSNHWIIQKGFLVANAVFLSLGTYSIGLMQSSSVKCEMYPIWAVSLFSFLCCVDSITAYSLEFKSQLWKMVYQLCLYSGYVLLLSISTISSGVGNIAVAVLSTITLMKGLHRTQALVVPGRMRSVIRAVPDYWNQYVSKEIAKSVTQSILAVHLSLDHLQMRTIQDPESEHSVVNWAPGDVTLLQINSRPNAGEEDNELWADVDVCKDVCLALSLSHVLQRRFLWCNERILTIWNNHRLLVSSWIVLRSDDGAVDYERAFRVVELELAFLYDILFTSNAFLHYFQAKTASVWAVASVVGVLFVGVAAAVAIPRTTTRQQGGTTTTDLIVTGVVVVSLALLQLLQLMRCWTSNWARVAFACDYARNNNQSRRNGIQEGIGGWQMRLRASLIRIHWLHSYLWQNKIGQLSLVESVSTRRECNNKLYRKFKGSLSRAYSSFSRILGLVYLEQMLHELLGSSHTGTGVELHADVKAAIAVFIREMIKSNIADEWSSTSVPARLLPFNRLQICSPERCLDAESYTLLILMWHIATCYCELAQQCEQCTGSCGDKATTEVVEKNHRVATLMSRYCAYLVASVPQLLPGQLMDTNDAYNAVVQKVGELVGMAEDKLGSLERAIEMEVLCTVKDKLCEIEKKLKPDCEQLRQVKDELCKIEKELKPNWERLFGIEVALRLVNIKLDEMKVVQDELDAVERSMERQKQALLRVKQGAKSSSGAVDMEKEWEAMRQVKDELDVMVRAMLSERDALQGLVDNRGRGWESSQRFMAALVKERENVKQAMCGARDKLSLMKKERKQRGILRCPKNASPEDIIVWSALDLGDRLQRQPAHERWKLLADFWVKALVYAAPSDNVEEHMQHLARGGEFITHIWALLSHHGILSWHEWDRTCIYTGGGGAGGGGGGGKEEEEEGGGGGGGGEGGGKEEEEEGGGGGDDDDDDEEEEEEEEDDDDEEEDEEEEEEEEEDHNDREGLVVRANK
ncbi:hypothetical protein HU200_041223 [Digitaria exilis]|uniref:DUF4220 domain-containing protein n=1 Tax=Digitaria exilis TaxID=1010633 RepID=A0A835B5J7_9POAL|nr:hypothetical protein HU200_041223 [Digitaria exilis]